MQECDVIVTPAFEKEFKRLAKRYRSLQADLQYLVPSLKVNPTQGAPLGRGAYKIRLSVQSKNRGKRGGARVISLHISVKGVLFLLAIYDKSEQENIDAKTLNRRIDETLSQWGFIDNS